MKSCELKTVTEDAKDMLHWHTKLSASKLVSYLPLNTIRDVLRISLDTYASEIEKNGGSYFIFGEEECCISSGAIYAFLSKDLDKVLKENRNFLILAGIPDEPRAFIQAIASRWFESEADIIPLLRRLFGEV